MPDVVRALKYMKAVMTPGAMQLSPKAQMEECRVVDACLQELAFLKRENAALRDENSGYTDQLRRAGIPPDQLQSYGLSPLVSQDIKPGTVELRNNDLRSDPFAARLTDVDPVTQYYSDRSVRYVGIDRQRAEAALRQVNESSRGLWEGPQESQTQNPTITAEFITKSPPDSEIPKSDAEAINAYLEAYKTAYDTIKGVADAIKSGRLLEEASLSNMLKAVANFGKSVRPGDGWLVFYRDRDNQPPVSVAFSPVEARAYAVALAEERRDEALAQTKKKKVQPDPEFARDLSRVVVELRTAWGEGERAAQRVIDARRDNLKAANARDNASTVEGQRLAQLSLCEFMRAGVAADDAKTRADMRIADAMKALLERVKQASDLAGSVEFALERVTALDSAMGVEDEAAKIRSARRRVAVMDSTPKAPSRADEFGEITDLIDKVLGQYMPSATRGGR